MKYYYIIYIYIVFLFVVNIFKKLTEDKRLTIRFFKKLIFKFKKTMIIYLNLIVNFIILIK